MLEIVVLSGKGGTGKTTLTGAFAHLAEHQVLCDLDVDAPDLHLIAGPRTLEEHDFISGHRAVIDPARCTDCGLCRGKCRYGAIRPTAQGLVVDPLKCEGCKVCVALCPAEAVDFREKLCGRWYLSASRFGPMVHAQLFPGEENSGRLVALLRKKARELAENRGLGLILCDGTPGIGCPVISSLSGVDLAVAVTEPTPSGRHDLERLVELCGHFKVPMGVIINKHDLNPDQSRALADFCAGRGLTLIGRLPHDTAMTEAMVRGQVITEYQSDGLGALVRRAWQDILALAGLVKAA